MAKAKRSLAKDKAAVAKAKHSLKKTARTAFRKDADAFFAKHPEVVSFSWKQYHSEHNREYNHPFACLYDYCPLFFKEGDQTLRLAPDGEVYNVLSDPDDEFFDGYEAELDLDEEAYGKLQDKAHRLSDEVRKLVRSFGEDELEAMFGDPVEVVVTPKKFEVEDYWDFE
jgi:hypothetical protein